MAALMIFLTESDNQLKDLCPLTRRLTAMFKSVSCGANPRLQALKNGQTDANFYNRNYPKTSAHQNISIRLIASRHY